MIQEQNLWEKMLQFFIKRIYGSIAKMLFPLSKTSKMNHVLKLGNISSIFVREILLWKS